MTKGSREDRLLQELEKADGAAAFVGAVLGKVLPLVVFAIFVVAVARWSRVAGLLLASLSVVGTLEAAFSYAMSRRRVVAGGLVASPRTARRFMLIEFAGVIAFVATAVILFAYLLSKP